MVLHPVTTLWSHNEIDEYESTKGAAQMLTKLLYTASTFVTVYSFTDKIMHQLAVDR